MIKEEERQRIGQAVAALRTSKGLTQRDLAELTGLTHGHIGRIETGRYSLTLDTLAKVAAALGCTVELIEKTHEN